ncbi:MAG: 50S ribosomal protein L10 [Kiritimatiellaeota bacterium]|nr:50S ribosomal protein L10 [Kiritimatiellota bacterium]
MGTEKTKQMRTEKQAMMREIVATLEASEYVIAITYSGLNAAKLKELRAALKATDAKAKIVKNTMLRKALEGRGWKVPDTLKGPTAMVTGKGEVTAVAKALANFVKANEKTAIKGGALSGNLLSTADVDALSKVPPREIMLGMFLGTLAAPMSGLVGVMSGKLRSLLYVLKAVEEKKNK